MPDHVHMLVSIAPKYAVSSVVGYIKGKSAIYLARYAREVEIVVRRESLRDTMSQYLIEQIEKTPNIRLRPGTEIERVEGEGHVEKVTLKSLADGSMRTEDADALFIFIGTSPRCGWLAADVLRDTKGFVLTGRDLMAADGYARIWKEQRDPLILETSVPGVFAAGDLRAGAMNRAKDPPMTRSGSVSTNSARRRLQ